MEPTKARSTEQIVADTAGNRVEVLFEKELYPLDAIYGASYVFIDRCFVLLDKPDANHIRVELRGREALNEQGLHDLAGEFGNELLTQTFRCRTAEHNRPIIEAIAARALAGSTGPEILEKFDDGEFSDDAFDDPLGIAIPWEEKYGSAEGPIGEDEAPPAGDPGPDKS